MRVEAYLLSTKLLLLLPPLIPATLLFLIVDLARVIMQKDEAMNCKAFTIDDVFSVELMYVLASTTDER